MLTSGGASAERRSEAGTDYDPEENRRNDNANNPRALAIKTDNLTFPERERGRRVPTEIGAGNACVSVATSTLSPLINADKRRSLMFL